LEARQVLDRASRSGKALRPLDPDLYDRMAEVVANGRSVRAPQSAGVLPPGSQIFADQLSFAGWASSERAARIRHRAHWVRRAAEAVEDSNHVFVDPDNGRGGGITPLPATARCP